MVTGWRLIYWLSAISCLFVSQYGLTKTTITADKGFNRVEESVPWVYFERNVHVQSFEEDSKNSTDLTSAHLRILQDSDVQPLYEAWDNVHIDRLSYDDKGGEDHISLDADRALMYESGEQNSVLEAFGNPSVIVFRSVTDDEVKIYNAKAQHVECLSETKVCLLRQNVHLATENSNLYGEFIIVDYGTGQLHAFEEDLTKRLSKNPVATDKKKNGSIEYRFD